MLATSWHRGSRQMPLFCRWKLRVVEVHNVDVSGDVEPWKALLATHVGWSRLL